MGKSSGKGSARVASASKSVSRGARRSNPMTPKAGFTLQRSRYGKGGKA